MLDLPAHHHALRQPLHAIGLFCAALRGADVPPQALGLVDGIAASSAAMEAALEALFAQLEAAAATTPAPMGASGAAVGTSALHNAAQTQDCTPAGAAPGVLQSSIGTPTATTMAAPDGTSGPDQPVQATPARPIDDAWTSPDTPTKEAVARETRRPRPPRVLIVDDDPSVRLSLELLLEAWGADVRSFDGAKELERFLMATPGQAPDLCVVDYHLGHTGQGLTAVELLRHTWPAPRMALVMMTGDVQAAHHARHAQPDLEVLVKPVAPAMLIALMERTVQGRAAAS